MRFHGKAWQIWSSITLHLMKVGTKGRATAYTVVVFLFSQPLSPKGKGCAPSGCNISICLTPIIIKTCKELSFLRSYFYAFEKRTSTIGNFIEERVHLFSEGMAVVTIFHFIDSWMLNRNDRN